MKVTNLKLEGLKLLDLDRHGDNRGWFEETYNYMIDIFNQDKGK